MTTPEEVTRDAPAGRVPRAVFTQGWTQLTYLHWRYDPAVIAPLLPAGVHPDVIDGSAWVGLIPFAMKRVGIFGTPPLPYLSSFLETNVRTYAVDDLGRRSVVFLTLEADRLLPVLAARATYRLPYAWASMSMSRSGSVITYASRRRWPGVVGATSNVVVRVGAKVEATALDDALTARWGLHSSWWGGRTVWAPVEHERWPLRAAIVEELDPSLVVAVGLPAPVGDPIALWSEGVHVRIGRPRPVAS